MKIHVYINICIEVAAIKYLSFPLQPNPSISLFFSYQNLPFRVCSARLICIGSTSISDGKQHINLEEAKSQNCIGCVKELTPGQQGLQAGIIWPPKKIIEP